MIIKRDGQTAMLVGGFISQEAAESLVLNEDTPTGVVTREPQNVQEALLLLREGIEPVAGDTESILGTTNDSTGLLLEEVGRFMAAVNTASDIADIKTAAQPLANALEPLVAAVDAKTCKLTHHVKGTGTVVKDHYTRAHAVAGVLETREWKRI